jgi:GAF domain-containing protein
VKIPDRPAQRVRLLLELARNVTQATDLQTVLDRSLAALRLIVDFDGGSIQLLDRGALRIAAGIPQPTTEALAFRLPPGNGLGGWVVSTGLPLYCPDATTDLRASPGGLARAAVSGVRSYLGAPIILGGETIGVVQINSSIVDAYTEDEQFHVLAFIPTIAAGIQNALHAVDQLVDLRDEIASGR